MSGYLCRWGASCGSPGGVIFYSLTHSRGKDLHIPFALTDTDKVTEAIMMQIWPKCVSSSDLISEVAGYV